MPPAIADGVYSVSPVRCKKSGLAPDYPDALKKALLQQFDGIESHKLTITGPNAVEEFKSQDCSLTVQREILHNSGARFGFRDNRKAKFAPSDCTFVVKFDGGVLNFGLENQIIPDRDQPDQEEVPFSVEVKPDGYLLTTADSGEINDVWEQYGCAAMDQLQYDLTR
jgi:hypothetical protein